MLAASPRRFAKRFLPAVLVVFHGCSDGTTPTAPRVELRAPSLDVVVVRVTNTDDSGPGSLRQAVFDTAATPGTVIQFDASLADGATLTIVNSTISGNVSQSNGGAISGAGDITIRNSTIAFNRGGDPNGGGAFNLGSAGKLSLRNSIISKRSRPDSSPGVPAQP